MILDSKLLQEPSSIAHNAFMSLVLLYSPSLDKKEHITLLVNGILRQQRQDGSYKIYFGNELENGLDFYPGEAMLALLAAYKLTNDESTWTAFNADSRIISLNIMKKVG